MWASVVLAQALSGPLAGIVVDADGRSITHAAVELACGATVVHATTDAAGSFAAAALTGECRVTASAAGFDPVTRSCASGLPAAACQIQLRPARRHEVVNVTAPVAILSTTARGGVGASLWSAEQLRMAGPDLPAWLALAELDAGNPIGIRDVRTDGMARGTMPPPRTVGAVRVNDDPFSVEATGVDQVRIALDATEPLLSWIVEARPPVPRLQRSDPLAGAPAPKVFDTAVTLGAGHSGRWRASMAASAQRTRYEEFPTFVDGPPGRDRLNASLQTRHVTTTIHTSTTVAHRGMTAAYHLTRSRLQISNAAVGGRAGPAYASSLNRSAWSHLVMVRVIAPGWQVRGGFAFDRGVDGERAGARGEGTILAGRLVSGAPDRVAEYGRKASWTARASAESSEPGRWLVGAEAIRRKVSTDVQYNPDGQTLLASSGTWLGHVRRPDAGAGIGEEVAGAVYGERRLVANHRLWLRGGLRVEWQQDLGLAVNPRVSFATSIARFILAGNAGLFVNRWTAEIAREAQGRRTSPEVWTGLGGPVVSDIDPGRRQDVVARISVTRLLGPWRFALQETATLGRGPGGLIRSWRGDQLVERLAHDRSLSRWQTHARVEWAPSDWMVGANYLYAHATDDGIGRLEAPAWSDQRGERAPSQGIARHRVTLVGRGMLPGRVSLIVTAVATSGVPYTLTTGEDPEGLRTFAGRRDPQRNAYSTPGSGDLSMSVSRSWRLPIAGLGCDTGLRAEHLAGGRTVFEVDTVASSVLAGRPIRAAHGPRVSVWATLVR